MAKKSKFLLVSLADEQAKKLAQVLSNSTSRRILEHLADGEDTETAISQKMQLPLSTVHYNLSLLVQGGLVESEEYHYSAKGKEIKHYKLANQYILIAPKSTFGLKERLKGLLPAVGIVGGIGIALSYLSQPIKEIATPDALQEGVIAMKAATSQMASVALEATPPLTEASTSLFTNIGLLFFLGGLLVFLLYLVIEYSRYQLSRKG